MAKEKTSEILTNLQFGDVFLVHFPNSDSTRGKPRPVMAMLNDKNCKQLKVACITSKIRTGEYWYVKVSPEEQKKTGLLQESMINLGNVATISYILLKDSKKIGKIPDSLEERVKEAMRNTYKL